MQERPILFSGAMIRAILAGTKTMTRRVIKPQPWKENAIEVHESLNTPGLPVMIEYFLGAGVWNEKRRIVPHIQPGNRLWVREQLRGDGQPGNKRRGFARYGADGEMVVACTDCHHVICDCGAGGGDVFWQWKKDVLPSIHMPRWACRLLLDVVSVRVERLQDISEADAVAEGVESTEANWRDYSVREEDNEGYDYCYTARESFITLWDSINAMRGYDWNTNPWVWVVEFKRVEATV